MPITQKDVFYVNNIKFGRNLWATATAVLSGHIFNATYGLKKRILYIDTNAGTCE